jgi:Thaumatin family
LGEPGAFRHTDIDRHVHQPVQRRHLGRRGGDGTADLASETNLCTDNTDCPLNQFCLKLQNNTTNPCPATPTPCPGKQFCDSSSMVCAYYQCTYVPVNGTVTHTDTACDSNSDCASDHFCDSLAPLDGKAGTCGSLPADANGWRMDSQATTNISVPASWSGRFFPRIGCAEDDKEFYCSTGECLGDKNTFSQYCAVSGNPPATLAEMTLVADSYDTYDVSQVDGFNVPVQMAPNPGTYSGSPDGKYTCGTAGCTATTCPSGSQLTACPWKLYTDPEMCPHGLKFVAVTPGVAVTPCAKDADCAAPTPTPTLSGVAASGPPSATPPATPPRPIACGVNGNTATLGCGDYAGCLSPNQACSIAPTVRQLDCSNAVSGQGTLSDLYGCAGPNATSCYTADIGDTCCGCPSWTSAYLGTSSCQNHNTSWEIPAGQSYPTCLTVTPPPAECLVQVLKENCPLSYSFAYDDPTSTFTCTSKSSTELLEYTITFCP